MKCLLALTCVLALSACGGSPTEPDHLNGTWSGSFSSTYSGNGTARMSLTVNGGGTLSGNWSVSNAAGTSSGVIGGSTQGSTSLSMTLTPSVPIYCPYNATATIDSDVMTGTWASFNCTVAASGSFRLTRQ